MTRLEATLIGIIVGAVICVWIAGIVFFAMDLNILITR